MNKKLIILIGISIIIGYLIFTGITQTTTYYFTPVELLSKDTTFYNVGVRVSGQVVPGSYQRIPNELLHTFTVRDLLDTSVTFQVEYRDALPSTFTDDVEVVLEGYLTTNNIFIANTLLTKCSSRYEASPEDLK